MILKELFDSIDVNKHGHITLEEFEKGFTVSDIRSELYLKDIIQKICVAIYKGRYQLKHVFGEMDLDGDGLLSFEEFKVALNSLNIATLDKPLTDDTIRVIFDSIDTDKSGNIDPKEFMAAFSLV